MEEVLFYVNSEICIDDWRTADMKHRKELRNDFNVCFKFQSPTLNYCILCVFVARERMRNARKPTKRAYMKNGKTQYPTAFFA